MSVIANILAINTDNLQLGFRFAYMWGKASRLNTLELPVAAGSGWFLGCVLLMLGVYSNHC